MAENLFILGAGASHDAGAPVMNNFFEKAQELFDKNKFDDDTEIIRKIFNYKAELHNIYGNTRLNLNDIEEIFGAIEMADLIGGLKTKAGEEIASIRESIIKLIVKTLEKSIYFNKERMRQIFPTDSYKAFSSFIYDNNEDVSIITLNYDIALDFALESRGFNVNYCLPSKMQNFIDKRRNIKLLKLHGSVNWGFHNKTNKIIPISVLQFNGVHQFKVDSGPVNIEISSIFGKTHGFEDYKELPIIVPPTWNKSQYNDQLKEVWKEAGTELSEAKNIYILGYSFPPNDLFFRYLFSIGTIHNTVIRRFWVFDPKKDVGDRYYNLVGEHIKSKPFTYYPCKFKEAIQGLDNLYKNKKEIVCLELQQKNDT